MPKKTILKRLTMKKIFITLLIISCFYFNLNYAPTPTETDKPAKWEILFHAKVFCAPIKATDLDDKDKPQNFIAGEGAKNFTKLYKEETTKTKTDCFVLIGHAKKNKKLAENAAMDLIKTEF